MVFKISKNWRFYEQNPGKAILPRKPSRMRIIARTKNIIARRIRTRHPRFTKYASTVRPAGHIRSSFCPYKKLYLYENETRIDNDVIRAARVKARDTDPVGYVTIEVMLVDYWHSVDLDQGLLDGIIEDWKTKAVAEGDKGRERGGTVRAITSYEQGATHKHWRRRHIMEYLSTRGAVMPQISTALMKRKPTDLPSPQYHTLPELLEKYWSDNNTPLTDISTIIVEFTTEVAAIGDDD